jgi:hypothetical protein
MPLLQTEYEQDYESWVKQHITLLQEGRVHELDIEHLIEELAGMARRDRHELISHLVILLAHLLKWEYQRQQLTEAWGQFTGKSWRNSLLEQRYRIQAQLENSPSLDNYLAEAILNAYPKAVSLAVKETQLPTPTFPTICPYSVQQVLNDEFYP